MSLVAAPHTPAEQVYTVTDAPSPDNAARFYPSCGDATAEELEQRRQEYAAGLLRFHKAMAGPEVAKGTPGLNSNTGLKSDTEPRRGSTGSDSSTGSSEGQVN